MSNRSVLMEQHHEREPSLLQTAAWSSTIGKVEQFEDEGNQYKVEKLDDTLMEKMNTSSQDNIDKSRDEESESEVEELDDTLIEELDTSSQGNINKSRDEETESEVEKVEDKASGEKAVWGGRRRFGMERGDTSCKAGMRLEASLAREGNRWVTLNKQVLGISGRPSSRDPRRNPIKDPSSWEKGCSLCGQYLKRKNKLKEGWYCEKGAFGIWLKRDKSPDNLPDICKAGTSGINFCTGTPCGGRMYVKDPNSQSYLDRKVMEAGSNWAKDCSICAQNLEKHGHITPGWYCWQDLSGIYIKRQPKGTQLDGFDETA